MNLVYISKKNDGLMSNPALDPGFKYKYECSHDIQNQIWCRDLPWTNLLRAFLMAPLKDNLE